MAISKDGFIAGLDDDTPWSDAAWEAFHAFVLSCDAVVLGRRTYEVMLANDEFVDGPHYFVATTDLDMDTGDFGKLHIRSRADMPAVERVGIIGGGDLNGRLAKMGIIDEMILDIEPIELKQGVRLFGKHDVPLKLEIVNSRQIGKNTIQRHYKVVH
jgi:dihydrofolate reductase